MRALIINLARETRRMALQRAQMEVLGIEREPIEVVTSAACQCYSEIPHLRVPETIRFKRRLPPPFGAARAVSARAAVAV